MRKYIMTGMLSLAAVIGAYSLKEHTVIERGVENIRVSGSDTPPQAHNRLTYRVCKKPDLVKLMPFLAQLDGRWESCLQDDHLHFWRSGDNVNLEVHLPNSECSALDSTTHVVSRSMNIAGAYLVLPQTPLGQQIIEDMNTIEKIYAGKTTTVPGKILDKYRIIEVWKPDKFSKYEGDYLYNLTVRRSRCF
jgi:hypothetical protein